MIKETEMSRYYIFIVAEPVQKTFKKFSFNLRNYEIPDIECYCRLSPLFVSFILDNWLVYLLISPSFFLLKIYFFTSVPTF